MSASVMLALVFADEEVASRRVAARPAYAKKLPSGPLAKRRERALKKGWRSATTLIVTLLALLLVRAALGLIAGRTGLIAAADLVTLLTWLALLVLLVATLLTLVLLALALLALTLLAGGGLVAARLTRLIALARLACFAAILLGLVLLLAVLFVLRVRLIGLLRIVLRVCHGGLLFWNRPTELPAFL